MRSSSHVPSVRRAKIECFQREALPRLGGVSHCEVTSEGRRLRIVRCAEDRYFGVQ
jgi:hypothetical protein